MNVSSHRYRYNISVRFGNYGILDERKKRELNRGKNATSRIKTIKCSRKLKKIDRCAINRQ